MENTSVTISVVIPLYNKAAFVERTLSGVFAQTFRDYEVIIVDDGSTDGSAELVETLIDGRGNYRIIRQSNSGVGAARNNGVLVSDGEYLCFLDADDWWEPTFLEEMLEFAGKFSDAGLWACNYIYYKPGKIRVGVNHPAGYMNYPKCYYENVGMPVWTGSVMMLRRVFDEMGAFPIGIKLGEDFLLWSKVAIKYQVAFLNRPLAYYNNDVPVSLRATRNLHHPEYNMLFRMQELEQSVEELDDAESKGQWHRLLDMLRVGGLLPYWMNPEYHNLAAKELEKVDWSQQPQSVIRTYKMPIWWLKGKNEFMKCGSFVKQKLIRLRRS